MSSTAHHTFPDSVPAPTFADTSAGTMKSTSRVRMSISSLRKLVAQDESVLPPNDIQALYKKGLLHLTATTSTAKRSNQDSTFSPPSTTSAGQPTVSPQLILSAATRSDGPPSHRMIRGVKRFVSNIHYGVKKERALPIYHDETIEDTCSHLYQDPHANTSPALAGFRRYSDSSRQFVARGGAPVANDTLASHSHSRRSSIATPEGTRTVLYQDSNGHMLLSLPAKTGTSTGDVAIDALKFPVTGAVSSTDTIVTTSPRLPSLSPSLSPSPPMRSKRKSSVPIRSPSSKDSQEASPGVIFQLPFGVPTVPTSPSPRKASTPSSSSTGSGSDTPPHICSYPTPVTTARTAFVSEINSQGAVSEEETGLSRFPTPTSPIDRSGLGIHVQRPLTETAPTHPLESSSAINVGTEVQQQQKPITFTEQDSGASIGDIVIAEQTFGTAVGQRRGEQTTTALSQPEIEVMPTPPSTSKIMPTGVMQGATLCLQDNARITQIPATFPQILFTPCPGYSSRTVDSAGSVKRSSEQTVMAAEGDDEKQEDHDISSLPLREQRLLSIRRRSLIPREDLDFMRGSGILPPASTDLVTKGGAKILSYSVLLSDVVNVQKESMRTQERETEEEELIPMATKAKAKSRPKRKRGGNNRKIHGGARGQRTRAHTHTPDGNDDEDDEEDIEGSLSVDEYDDYDGQEEEHLHVDRQQHGYMSVSSQKRLRSLNGNDVESAETQKTTRIVPERHGPSTYRRRYSKSPTSPSLLHKDPASYTHSPRGSPSLMPEVDIESEDVNMEDAEILIDDYDYDDVHDADGRPQDYHGAKEIPKELWIPAAEVKVVMKLAREMLEAEERLNLHQPQKVARNNNRRPSVKTLKASATDQNGDVADPPKKSKLSTAKSATKVKAKNTSDQPKSVSSPGSTKVKEGKPAKECEACKEKSTPCWRPGYTPGASLCNSCGLRYKKSGVFCPKDGCKYIPLKTEYASMEDERIRAGRDHLLCRSCKGRVERPTRA